MFFPFYNLLFSQWSSFMKATTENQLHDFLISCGHSCKKYCVHNWALWGITITVDPPIKFELKKGDCFFKKVLFSRVFPRWPWFFFLTDQTNFLYWSSSPKRKQKPDVGSCQSTKIDNFSRSDPLKVWQPLSPRFFRWLQLSFKIFTTGTKGGIIPKSERNPDVRD